MPLAPDKFLADLASDDAEIRFAAWDQADEMDPEVVRPLTRLLAAESAKTRYAADQALQKLVHSVGKRTEDERRKKVASELSALLASDAGDWVKANALRALSLIGDDDAVPGAAALLGEAKLREEAVFCLERIPAEAALGALREACPEAPPEFQPRILAALGHRRDAAAVDLLVEALESENPEIAIGAMKALARIGEKIDVKLDVPDPDALSDWRKIERSDSALRYADSQAEQGEYAQAWKIYNAMLNRAEQHLQCAAIIGLAKMGTSGAAAAIFPKLTSESNQVRRTAAQAWRRMRRNAQGARL